MWHLFVREKGRGNQKITRKREKMANEKQTNKRTQKSCQTKTKK